MVNLSSDDDDDELLSYDSPSKRTARSGVVPTKANNSPNHESVALLDFYRERCEKFQSERRLMLEHLTNVEVGHSQPHTQYGRCDTSSLYTNMEVDGIANPQVSKEELHRIKWDLKMRKQEMAELESSLKTANATVFQLKEEMLALEMANETLRMKEQEDRRKIQQLLVLTQTVTEEVSFVRDCRPGATASYPIRQSPGAMTYPYLSTMHIGSEEMLSSRTQHQRGRVEMAAARQMTTTATTTTTTTTKKHVARSTATATASSSVKSSAPNQVLRTIYMRNDQADALTSAMASLQQQLTKQQQLHHERTQQLLDEFAEEKLKLQHEVNHFQESNELLEKQLSKTQRLFQKTTKDYLVLRHQSQEAERTTQEELLSVTEKCHKLVSEKLRATKDAMAEADATKAKAEEDSELYTQQLRDQALSRERDLHILREQYAAVQEACTRRIQDLQTRLTKLRARYRSLEKRRTMEMEGFTRDIAATKRHLQRLETALYGRRVYLKQPQQQEQHMSTQARGFRQRDHNDVSQSTDLNDEIAALQQRVADLAADVDAS